MFKLSDLLKTKLSIFFLSTGSDLSVCGQNDTRFFNEAMFNMNREFSSIEQLKILNITDSWHKSAEAENIFLTPRRYKHI